MAREKVEYDVIGNDRGGSKAFKDTGDAAGKAGKQVNEFKDELKRLDGQVDDSRKQLAELARDFARTGDKDLWKGIRKQRGELRRLLDAKKLMEDVGGDAAEGISTGLFARIGPLVVSKMPAALNPAVLAAAAGPAAVLATTLGAAAAGGIIGGAAGVGIVGGLVVASNHPLVQASAKSLGAEISRSLEIDSAAFVPAAQDAIGILRTEWERGRDDIADILSSTSTFVKPLTEGAAAGFRGILAGIRDLSVRAGPVINSISAGVAGFGEAVGEGLSALADNSDDAAHALGVVFITLEAGSRAALGAINALTELYSVMRLIGAARNGDIAAVGAWVASQEHAQESTSNFTGDLQALLEGFKASSAAAAAATAQYQSWTEKMRAHQDQTLANLNAEVAYQQAIDDAAAARRDNGKTLDINTQKGRDNMTSLLGIAQAAKENADSIRNMTASEDLASEAIEKGRKAFIAQAHAMGMSIPKAKELATRIFGIPTVWKSTVTVVTKEAEENLKTVAALIRAIKSKRVVITVDRRGRETTRSEGRNVGIGDNIGGRSEGGRIIGPGSGTSDDIIQRVSNGEYVIRAAAARVIGYDTLDAWNQADRGAAVPAPAIRRPVAAQGGAAFDEERMVRALARALSGVTLQVDDRRARFIDQLVRGG